MSSHLIISMSGSTIHTRIILIINIHVHVRMIMYVQIITRYKCGFSHLVESNDFNTSHLRFFSSHFVLGTKL